MAPIIRNNVPLIASGQVAIDQNCCCEGVAPCGNCTEAPSFVTLTASGFGNNACTNCTALNGTFVLNFNFSLSCPIPGPPPLCGSCYYDYNLGTGTVCGFSETIRWRVRLDYFSSGGPGAYTQVQAFIAGFASTIGPLILNKLGDQCHQVGTCNMGELNPPGWGSCTGAGSNVVVVV